jgi:hypothetical protein
MKKNNFFHNLTYFKDLLKFLIYNIHFKKINKLEVKKKEKRIFSSRQN